MPTHPLLAIARTMGNPVIETGRATFIWRGATAPLLVGDTTRWDEEPQTLQRILPDLWAREIKIPDDSYIEYAFLDPKTGARLPDPLNPRRVPNGAGDFNHYFYMPRVGPTPLAHSFNKIPAGTLTRHRVATRGYAAGAQRAVTLYRPPIDEPVPLVIVLDGSDYLRRAKLNVIVDNLIAGKRLRPFAMAFVQDGGPARSLEYSCAEGTLDFLFECVIPLAQDQIALIPPGGVPYGLIGAGLGGSMAVYSALRMPQVFGKVLSQSGIFCLARREFVVMDLARHVPPAPVEFWLDAGRFDPSLECNRLMYEILKEKQYKVRYHEFSGGHNFTAWRDDLWHGLEALFR